jgi:hypothetical protein
MEPTAATRAKEPSQLKSGHPIGQAPYVIAIPETRQAWPQASIPSERLPDESTSSFPIHDVLEHRRSPEDHPPKIGAPSARKRQVFCVPISKPAVTGF